MSNERKHKIIVIGQGGYANYYSLFAKICGNKIQILTADNKLSGTKMKRWDIYFDYERESSKNQHYGWYRKHDKKRKNLK